MRKAIRIISAADIKQQYSMQKAIDAMERAFSSLSSGESYVPLRYVSQLPTNGLLMLAKPAYVEKEKRLSLKILTQRSDAQIRDLPLIQGIVLLMDAESGEILSMMDGEYITALRTGAASGLATRFFARKDARVMALFGCGTQGRTQVEAVLCERDIQKIFVFDRMKAAAQEFIKEMQPKTGIEILYSEDTNVLKDVDVICTATNSREPLFAKEDLKKGVHINAVGSFRPDMQELDPYIVKDARVFVDQAEACLKESGDLIKPLSDGIIADDHLAGEIGGFALGRIKGRQDANEITVFKSVGVAIQDYAVASEIYTMSLKEGFGQEINLFE